MLAAVISYLKRHLEVLAIVGAALLVASGVSWVRTILYERDQAVIAKNNAEADRDSLVVKYSDDSVQVFGQLAWSWREIVSLRNQLTKAGDAKAVTTVTIRPKGQTDTHTVPLRTQDTTVVIADTLRGPPVDVFAGVVIKGPNASIQWRTRPWPIPLTVDVGCRDRLKPDVLVKVPKWVTVDSVRTNVQDKVCDAREKPHHGWGYWAVRIGGAATLFGLGAATN